ERTPAAATSTAIGICLPFGCSGSPYGLTVAGQRRLFTGFPLRGTTDCRRSLPLAQLPGDAVDERATVPTDSIRESFTIAIGSHRTVHIPDGYLSPSTCGTLTA